MLLPLNIYSNLQQNIMNKTLRAVSLPRLKLSQQAGSYKDLLESIPKSIRTSKPQQIIQIGSYVFKKSHLLGRGFCSAVYKGQHKNSNETVAIKIIELDKIKGKVQKRLIKNQIKSLHELKNSRNILKMLEILTNKQYVAFVTQICKESLLQKLKSNNASKKSSLQKNEAIKIMKQITKGYSQLRNHNLLHRDLKPANILIGLDGEARLGDFGFSIRDEQVQLDRNVNIGSPLYMAPEVLKGNNYSSKADIWSIGLIFLEMLIGDLPWSNVKQCNLHAKLLELNYKSIIPLDLEEKYSEMLLRCFQIDPRKRIGIRQMMNYLFTQQQLFQIKNPQKIMPAHDNSVKKIKNSIPTSITQNQDQKSSDQYSLPIFQTTNICINNLYETKINKFSENRYNRNYKALSSQQIKLKDNIDSENEIQISLKLNLNGLENRQYMIKQRMSQLHYCRFLFKIVQLINKGQDNIHYTYFNMNQQIKMDLAHAILYSLQQIRLINNNFSSTAIREFRKSKEFRKVLQLTQQYYKNYIQFFQIQLKTHVEGKMIDADYLIEQLLVYLKNGKEHFALILEQVEKSQLKVITDNEICQFSYLIDFMERLVHLLKFKKKGLQHFVKYGKIEDLANIKIGSISLIQLRKIYQRLDK